jgi:hypothetical protein
MIQQYYSIRIELDKVLQSSDYEQLVFENLKRCKRLIGIKFNVIFWCNNLDKNVVKKFTKRNEDTLFNLGATITKEIGRTWFLIQSSKEEKSNSRYTYKGDVLEGIVEYLGIINHMLKRDNQ